jgi:hypothetical protein
MNMQVIRKSRKRAIPGDIFVYQLPDNLYRYGRIIRTDVSGGGFSSCILLYFYRLDSWQKTPIPDLDKDDLLIPPQMTDRYFWTHGYFETIEHRELGQEDVWPVHCFWDLVYKRYVDEYGDPLARRYEPCGTFLYRTKITLDDDISKALGFLLSPPPPDALRGKPFRLFKNRLAEYLEQGYSKEEAKVQALKDALGDDNEGLGVDINEYAWPEIRTK